MNKRKYYQITGIRSRITIGQIKGIIQDSECKYTRALFTEILYRMASQQIGWLYLTFKGDDLTS